MLFRSQGQACQAPIVFRPDLAVFTDPRPAESPPAFRDLALVKTRGALHLCRTTSKRWSVQPVSCGERPAFCFAISSCFSTVSTPSRSGSNRPRFPPLETMTPYFFTSSWSGESMTSAGMSTSTLMSRSSSSQGLCQSR